MHVDWDSGKQDLMNSGAEGLTIDFKHWEKGREMIAWYGEISVYWELNSNSSYEGGRLLVPARAMLLQATIRSNLKEIDRISEETE